MKQTKSHNGLGSSQALCCMSFPSLCPAFPVSLYNTVKIKRNAKKQKLFLTSLNTVTKIQFTPNAVCTVLQTRSVKFERHKHFPDMPNERRHGK